MRKVFKKKDIIIAAGFIFIAAAVSVFGGYFGDEQKDNAIPQEEQNIAKEIKFIKIKGCPDEAYESKDNFNLNYYLCRSYMTDGEYVYYHGARAVPSSVIQIQSLVPSFIATSSPDTKDSDLMASTIIDGADAETFEIFLFENKASMTKQNPSFSFARDKNHLYWEGKRFEGVDPNTFAVLGRGFIKDKDSVYYQEQKLKGSDPETFEFLAGSYSKDKNNVYLNAKIIKNADPETFTFLVNKYQKDGYSAFSKDKNAVYFQGDILQGADPETFTSIDYQFSKDAMSLYDPNKSLKPILTAEKGELISLGSNYFKDDINVWFRDTKPELGGMIELGIVKIKQADAPSFKALSLGYARDVNRLYFGKDEIKGADPKTFSVVEGNFIKDSQSVYYKGIKLEGLNPDAAYVIKEKYVDEYIADDALIFYENTQLVDVDVETFKIYKGRSRYSEDAKRVYHMGKLLEGYVPGKMEFLSECNFIFVKNTSYLHRASEIVLVVPEPIKIDDETFEIIENCFAKDKNQIITPNVKIIEGADVAAFTPLGGLYSKDKNNVWYDNKLIEDADIATFTVRGSGYGAKDKNKCYRLGESETCPREPPRINQTFPPPPPFR